MPRFAALALTAVATAMLAGAAPTSAQQTAPETPTIQSMCGKRADIVDALSKEFSEAPMAMGMVDQTAVMEVFVSEGGTWTIIASRTDGSSCIVASGEGWQSETLVAGKDA